MNVSSITVQTVVMFYCGAANRVGSLPGHTSVWDVALRAHRHGSFGGKDKNNASRCRV